MHEVMICYLISVIICMTTCAYAFWKCNGYLTFGGLVACFALSIMPIYNILMVTVAIIHAIEQRKGGLNAT